MTFLIPVILCGGAGTRLWPVSRENMPKPFMRVLGQHSLLQNTLLRAAAMTGVTEVVVVTNVQYAYKVAEELSGLNTNIKVTLLLEPEPRDTAAAIALAALWIQAQFGADALMLVLPADHQINAPEAFFHGVSVASELAQAGWISLLGITPHAPETGFGYIRLGTPWGTAGAYQAAGFVEKPTRAVAEAYLRSGEYVWNSGMFCFSAGVIAHAFATWAPALWRAAQTTFAEATGTHETVHFPAASFQQIPRISIDYAVMEHANRLAVVPCDMGWSDVGHWKAVADVLPTDAQGNTVQGQALLLDAKGTYVQSPRRWVAAVGVDDLVIIDTDDAVLVAHKNATQRVKDVVALLKTSDHHSPTREHLCVERPWGTYTVLEEGPHYKIKHIRVNPGGRLSLQMHHRRSEHWVVVSGTARVTRGEQVYVVARNESTFIPLGEKHRLENPEEEPLVLIEVQCGDYLGEDDVVRFSDQYGRAPSS